MFLTRLIQAHESLKDLIKTKCKLTFSLGQSPRVCISNKFLGNAKAAALYHTEEQRARLPNLNIQRAQRR